jgi:uncharacterized OB-fold protein
VVVRLEEGAFLVRNVVDCPPEGLAVGMPVEVTIAEVEAVLRLALVPRVALTRGAIG